MAVVVDGALEQAAADNRFFIPEESEHPAYAFLSSSPVEP